MRYFWTLETFDPAQVTQNINLAYQKLIPYIKEFLCAEHPYRPGKMCPFMPSAVKNDVVYFTAAPEEAGDHIYDHMINECIAFFKKCQQSSRQALPALVIIFPEDFDTGKILELHRRSRMRCMKEGQLLGVLYPTNQAYSLHENSYFPLRTPVPVLAIRDVVSNDVVFFDDTVGNVQDKLASLRVFIGKFENETSAKAQNAVSAARRKYTKYLYKRRGLLALKYFALFLPLLIAIAWWWLSGH